MGGSGDVAMEKPLERLVSYEEEEKCGAIVFSCSMVATARKLVCVTSGNSLLGSEIVKTLLTRRYLVRVTIQNEVDLDDMKHLMKEEEMIQLESVVIAKMGDLDSLINAFRGCHAIFHTSSFIDPHGISGYSERMVFLEIEGARNVIEACSKAAYVKRCIFTSSLLACVWKNDNMNGILDERSWSDDDFCRDNKLWFALSKTGAEKVAWMKSKELKVKLVTLCPALLVSSSFPDAYTQSSIPYLKGGRAMLANGLLAIVDVKNVAVAHAHAYEAMDYAKNGRYLCFDHVLRNVEDAIQLQNTLKMHGLVISNSSESFKNVEM